MFSYEYEKRRSSVRSADSRATASDWGLESGSEPGRSDRASIAKRPLPPRPAPDNMPVLPTKTSVPLKVWVIACASCLAVCAALVLATVVITKWGTHQEYATRDLFESPEPIYSSSSREMKILNAPPTTTESVATNTNDIDDEIKLPILEKLSIFNNMVANRAKNKRNDDKKDTNLISKPQLHPIHDPMLDHVERRIEKKDKAKLLDQSAVPKLKDMNKAKIALPAFVPTLPDVFLDKDADIKLPDGYIAGLRKHDTDYFEEYYNDENLYEDYMQSNSMTSYLIEKVQELHDWITSDPDFDAVVNKSKKINTGNRFGQLLNALNESLLEGNVSIVMNKLKDLYLVENLTSPDHDKKIILSNSTDLLSFGILTLDVMLLHNIQLMAWENQENARNKMLKDPDVFAFNALFLEPSKVEAKRNEILHRDSGFSKRQNLRHETSEDFDISKNLIENVLEIGMSTARAAIHLGRAYKNTKNVMNQLSNREAHNTNTQNKISRDIDGNTQALNHLQTSFRNDSSSSVANTTGSFYTELDCVWLLYCKNLAATAKLNPPYGTMARINGVALRMLSGELSADRALHTMLYEALAGWTELNCDQMFPRCSKANAADVVLDSILQPLRKSLSNRLR